MAMRFRVLGPIEVYAGDRLLPVAGTRLPAVVAALLFNANRTVTPGQLARSVWADPPRTVGSSIRTYIAQLRAALAAAGEPESRLLTDSAGYRLAVGGQDEVDLDRFEELAGRGSQALDRAVPATAADLLTRSLELWRDTALSGITAGPALQAEVARLEERRLAVTERWAEAALAAGRHQELTADLSRLVRTHPLREKLWAYLMLALFRGGRQAEALEAYRDAYRFLTDEFGITPGRLLQDLQQRIIRCDPALEPGQRRAEPAATPPPAGPPHAGPPAVPVPRQLPTDIASFVGRTDELRQLDKLLPAAVRSAHGPVVITAIAGAAGVGKTALALHWAHGVADQFPDGQLYLDLRGYAPGPPVRPADALGALLRALGVAAARIPAEPDEAAGMFRSLLADRRTLILLDNAASPQQVRPLLPGTPGSVVLVTSRDRLNGLVAREGAQRFTVGVLHPREASQLLATMIGGDRVEAEPAAAERIVALCGRLPLALRVAAANLADRPELSLEAFATALADGDRLAALSTGDDPQSTVMAGLDLSYERLAAPARRLFRLLGWLGCGHFSAALVRRLLGVSAAEADGALGALVRAHLAEPHRDHRLRLHDLLRLYAAARAETEEPAQERTAALRRVGGWYLDLLREGASDAGPTPAAAALLRAERRNLFAVLRLAAQVPECQHLAAELARAISRPVRAGENGDDWDDVLTTALEAVRSGGDPHHVADLLEARARARSDRGRLDAAAADDKEAMALYRASGDRVGELRAQINDGVTRHLRGRLGDPVGFYRGLLPPAQALDEPRLEAYLLANLAAAERQSGECLAAIAHARAALVIFRELGDWQGEADALDELGDSYHVAGDHTASVRAYHAALRLVEGRDVRRCGDYLWHLGEVLRGQGHLAEAATALGRAVELLTDTNAAKAAAAARTLTELRGPR